ncbi:hypothetical protein [Proteiniclasticum sp.]|uniref:hypothetical protein n=1 Tax=Proteiniclasticum sp. TaxID=2053595 RepID=UPI002896CDC3|nr:hypothetical protein [Proteiniclasticum sp.]
MKKKIVILLLSLLLIAMMGCSDQEMKNDPAGVPEDVTGTETEVEGEVEKKENEESEGFNVEKNLMSVELTLPSEFAGDLGGFSRDTYLKENPGISDAKVLDDGSLWLKMSRTKHKELIKQMEENMITSFNELIEGEETPYILDIKSSKDYRKVEVFVDRAGYENSFDLSGMTIFFSVGFYHTIQGEDFKLNLQYIDAETEEIIEESVFPEE